MRALVLVIITTAPLVWAIPSRCAEAPTIQPALMEQTSVRLGLDEAVARALDSSARIDRQEALLEAARAEKRGAVSARWPEISLLGGYTRQSDVPELLLTMPNGQKTTIYPNLPDNARARASLALPLFTGGRIGSLINAARLEESAARSDLAAQKLDLGLEVRSAYWSLVTTRAATSVLEEALAAYEAHLKDARHREQFGLSARNEVLAVEVERDRAELTLIEAQNGACVTNASLVRLVGLNPGASIDPSESLEGGARDDNWDEIEALVALALRERPERASLAERVSSAQARVNAARAAFMPQIALAGGYDYANPNRRFMPPAEAWKDSWDVGVNVAFTLFDGGRTAAAVARTRALADALKAQLNDLDGLIRLQVTERRLAVESAAKAVLVAERRLASARENRRVAADRYREGLIASSDLLDAEVALLRAGLDRLETLARARLARAGLERALGR